MCVGQREGKCAFLFVCVLSQGRDFCESGLTREWVHRLAPIISAGFIFHGALPSMSHHYIVIMPSFKPFVQVNYFSFFLCLSKCYSSSQWCQFFRSVYPTVFLNSYLLMDTSMSVCTTYWTLVTSSFMKAIHSVLILTSFVVPPLFRKGQVIQKLKIPNCQWLNSVKF